MKPFNLEEYLKNPDRKVVTRDGIRARVICTDRKSESFPIIALVDSGKEAEKVHSFTKDGKFSDGGVRDLDLFFASEKHKGWMNIYKFSMPSGDYKGSFIWPTEEEAKSAADSDPVATVKIEWEE